MLIIQKFWFTCYGFFKRLHLIVNGRMHIANVLIAFLVIILSSCHNSQPASSNDTRDDPWIKAFKDRVFESCLRGSYKNDTIFHLIEQEDIFNPYEGIYIFDNTVHLADSAGRAAASQIRPTGYGDYEGKNYFMSSCLLYYTSKELDAFARKEFENYKKERAEE